MLSFLQAIILGVVEGITEFLPISSTAHLILASDLLHIPQTDFQKTFEIVIQLGAMLAVIIMYWRTFLQNFEVLKRVIVAFIPTGIIGLLLYSFIKRVLIGNTDVVLWSLFLGGIILLLFEWYHREPLGVPSSDELTRITYQQCLIIGTCQALAVIPGVSRSAATIVSGLALGIRRRTMVEFSFLLAVPTMIAATGLDLFKSAHTFSSGNVTLLAVGFVVAFLVAWVSIRQLLRYVQRHDFKVFGAYRILVALAFAATRI